MKKGYNQVRTSKKGIQGFKDLADKFCCLAVIIYSFLFRRAEFFFKAGTPYLALGPVLWAALARRRSAIQCSRLPKLVGRLAGSCVPATVTCCLRVPRGLKLSAALAPVRPGPVVIKEGPGALTGSQLR